jgi:hypothetical protein
MHVPFVISGSLASREICPPATDLPRSGLPRRALLLLAAALGGCAAPPAPAPPRLSAPPATETPPAVIESGAQFLPLDRTARESILCSALAQRMLSDGRLEVLASLKNQTNRPIQVELECLFKDSQGAAIAEATPWRKIDLGGNSNETVRFVSADSRAVRFTIAVKGTP